MAVAKDEKFLIQGAVGAIELILRVGDSAGALADRGFCAVVCHPHPLHGGTMDNKVVTTLARAYRELGVPVVRFNFRGVGESAGSHGDGVGEVEDLAAVVAWLRAHTAASKVLLAGFSFGSGVVSNGCLAIANVAHAVFVAPPVGRYNFSAAMNFPCPLCVVMGDQDELVDAQAVYRWAQGLNPAPDVIAMPEAGHFFHGLLVPLRERLMATLVRQLAIA